MGVPKFLPREKKGTLNMRINKKLLDDISDYAILTETTVTDIVTSLIKDFMENKVVTNDYLDFGATFNIPLSEKGRRYYEDGKRNLKELKEDNITVLNGFRTNIATKPLEIKGIPNNLDIFHDGTFESEDLDLLHEGIDFYVERDLIHHGRFEFNKREYLNYIYCFYFEVNESREVNVYLCDYMEAINYLEGKDDITKDKIISCVKELKQLSIQLYDLFVAIVDEEKRKISEEEEVELFGKLDEKLHKIANKYNSGNIIPFGSDIETRVVLNEIESENELDKKIKELKELVGTEGKYNQMIESVKDEIDDIMIKVKDICNGEEFSLDDYEIIE